MATELLLNDKLELRGSPTEDVTREVTVGGMGIETFWLDCCVLTAEKAADDPGAISTPAGNNAAGNGGLDNDGNTGLDDSGLKVRLVLGRLCFAFGFIDVVVEEPLIDTLLADKLVWSPVCDVTPVVSVEAGGLSVVPEFVKPVVTLGN